MTEALILGYDPIDADHERFVRLLSATTAANDLDFPDLFRQLAHEMREHFAHENSLMESSGYPALGEHRGEHQRILGELEQFLQRLARGRIHFCRAYVSETLPGWFKLHLSTMDASLVRHLKEGT